MSGTVQGEPVSNQSPPCVTRQIDGIAPTFEKKPSIRQADDGRILYFECVILAEPEPTVAWYHNGNLIVQKGRFSVSGVTPLPSPLTLSPQASLDPKKAKTYLSVMKIQDVSVEDAGKYKVIAKNELGESNASISLNFDGRLSGEWSRE